MKTRNAFKDSNWVQTITSILALLFSLLVAFGVITPEQSVQALPEATNIVTLVSGIIAGVVALVGILFKPSA